MLDEKITAIKTTFTYDKVTNVIGWLHPQNHRSIKPKLHKRTKYGSLPYFYCAGRGGKHYKTDLIKKVLGELNEQNSKRCI